MTDLTMQRPLHDDLETQNDEALRDLAARIKDILASRHKERQAQAVATMRRLAKEHGLNLEVKRKPRKRGRPAKADRAAG